MVGWLAGWLACLLVKLSWFCMCRSCNASKHTVNKFIICWMKQATNKKNNNSNTTNSSSNSKKKYEKTTINYPAIQTQTQTHTRHIYYFSISISLFVLWYSCSTNQWKRSDFLTNRNEREKKKKEQPKATKTFIQFSFSIPLSPFFFLSRSVRKKIKLQSKVMILSSTVWLWSWLSSYIIYLVRHKINLKCAERAAEIRPVKCMIGKFTTEDRSCNRIEL